MASSSHAVLFDIGNVLVRWDPERLYAELLPDAADRRRFLTDICTMAWHGEHDRGVPMADNAAPLIARHPDYESAIRAWDERWDDMFDGPIEGTVRLVERLEARGVALFALTNLPAEKKSHIFETLPFLTRFEDVVVSGEEGVVKPDPRIYDIAAQRIGRPPETVLFVDDREENVSAARAKGFHAVAFLDAARLERDLVAFGVLAEEASA